MWLTLVCYHNCVLLAQNKNGAATKELESSFVFIWKTIKNNKNFICINFKSLTVA